MSEEQLKDRRFYGRRRGRPLSTLQVNAVSSHAPSLLLPGIDNGFVPQSIFPEAQAIFCEIGFGNGDFLADQLKKHPENAYIGIEPFENGFANFLRRFEAAGVGGENIRLHNDDAITLLDKFGDACLDGIYILNPDPWPKSRHHKRRIVRPETVEIYARLLKDGGQLMMTTDVDELAEWMATHAANSPDFEWTAERQEDWETPPEGWLATRYEQKGADAGRTQSYLIFKRKSR